MVIYTTISASWPKCGFLRHSVYVLLTYPTYFQINHALNCFILPLKISLTVLKNINHYEPSYLSRRATIPSKPVGRGAVLFVHLYVYVGI